MILFWASLLSLTTGLSLGLLGGGGSIMTVPILVYVLGLEARSAVATSLVVVGATSAVGALTHARAGRVKWRQGLLFGVAGMAGALAGGQLGKLLPAPLLLVIFSGMILATAMAMLRPRPSAPTSPPAAGSRLRYLLRVGRDGVAVGLLTGLVGAGGGFMVVPALALLGGLEMTEAVATSLLVITLNSAAGLVSTQLAGVPVDWAVAGGMSAASIIGSLLGARLGRRLSQQSLRRAFALFVVVLGLFILVRELVALLHLSRASIQALSGGAGAVALLALGCMAVRRSRRARVAAAR